MSDTGYETPQQAAERKLWTTIITVFVLCTALFIGGTFVWEEQHGPALPLPIATEGANGAFSEHAIPRSGKWPAVRRAYLAKHPNCQACGRTEKQSGQAIECHHVVPFHDDMSKETDPDNLISLCRRCHELLGHLDRWSSFNESVREDADNMLKKIKNRP